MRHAGLRTGRRFDRLEPDGQRAFPASYTISFRCARSERAKRDDLAMFCRTHQRHDLKVTNRTEFTRRNRYNMARFRCYRVEW